MNAGYLFERKFVEIVDRMLKERNLEYADFSRAVFSVGQAKADNKWQRIKTNSKKPQRLTLEDAHCIALFFGYDFDDFITKICKEARQDPTLKKACVAA